MTHSPANSVLEKFKLLDEAVQTVDLSRYTPANLNIEPTVVTETVTSLIGKLATCRLEYCMHPEDDRGIKGYRPSDRLQRVERELIGATAVLNAIAPLDMLQGEYFPERVDEKSLADPEHAIHETLSWRDLISHQANIAVRAAKNQSGLIPAPK